MLVVNKMDTEGAWDKYKEIEKALRNLNGNNLIYWVEHARTEKVDFNSLSSNRKLIRISNSFF